MSAGFTRSRRGPAANCNIGREFAVVWNLRVSGITRWFREYVSPGVVGARGQGGEGREAARRAWGEGRGGALAEVEEDARERRRRLLSSAGREGRAPVLFTGQLAK